MTEKIKVGLAKKTKLIPEEVEAPIIKRIFQMALVGNGIKEIVNKLNEEGIRTRAGNPFSTTTINHILRNEVYIGSLVWRLKNSRFGYAAKNDTGDIIRIHNCHEAIIDENEFKKVQLML